MRKLLVLMVAVFILCGCKFNQSATSGLDDANGKSIYLYGSSMKNAEDVVCRFSCSDVPTQQTKKDLCNSPEYIKQSVLEGSEDLSSFLQNIKSISSSAVKQITSEQTKTINSFYSSSTSTTEESSESTEDTGFNEFLHGIFGENSTSETGTLDAEEVCGSILESSTKTIVVGVSLEEGTEGESDANIVNTGEYKCYKADQDICAIEAAIFKETNAYRQRSGLKPFQASASVSYVARDWSIKQARRGGIGHDGFSSSRWTVLRDLLSIKSLDANKIRGLSRENVAMNYARGSSEDTGKAFTNQWLNSSGHLANIRASSTYLGVGVAKSGSGAYYATQIFAY